MSYKATKSELVELLSRHKFQYQRVPLPHGLEIPGRDREPLMQALFPKNFESHSVLDVGCSLGYFLLQAEHRGAGDCVGLEANREMFEQARDIRDTLGSRVHLENRYFDGWDQPADYVLCFNVLHHVLDPISMLQQLVALTRHTLLLEYVTPLNGKYKYPVTDAMMKQPLMVLGEGTKPGKILTYAFTPAALEKILRQHLGLSGTIKHGKSPEQDRRWLRWSRK